MNPDRILIVEDDVDNGRSLLDAIGELGYATELAATGTAGIAAFRARGADVVLTDLVLPDVDGIEVMKQIRALDAGRTPVILMTAYGSVDSSVRAMKDGAYDYLQKPLDVDDLQAKLDRALEAARLRKQVEQLSAEVRGGWSAKSWVAESAAMREVVRQTLALAQANATVLVRGESGTGKELVARALHADGPRAGGPFVAVNCAAFAESLEALRTDYIDLYLIHWPADGFEQAWADLEELYVVGKIKAIGVSNFHRLHLEQLEKTAKILPAVNQIESHPYLSNQELIDLCHSKGMAVEVWSPLGGIKGNVLEDAVLHELASKYGKTPAQIVLRWDIQRNVIVIPKSVHRERILSNQDVFDFELSQEDMALISSLNRNQRVGSDPDHFDF